MQYQYIIIGLVIAAAAVGLAIMLYRTFKIARCMCGRDPKKCSSRSQCTSAAEQDNEPK